MKILLIISSSIAATKCEEVVHYLKENNVDVDCIITENTKNIINYKKLRKIISGNLYDDKSENKEMLHIKLSRKADLIVICPATANTIAKYANGYADNLASTTLIASNKQVVCVPAMNSEMWNNKINQINVKLLTDIGVEFVGPMYGKLSCGEIGLGRLATPKKIFENILVKLNKTKIFKDKKCIVTAGPTIEEVDSVRYLSNYSSGKQGYEIANQLALSGAFVTLISGPTNLQPPFNVKLIKVKTAKEMLVVVKKIKKVHIGIFAAAVADFRPKKIYKTKLKKNKLKKIELIENIDILKYVGNKKNIRPQVLVGFAAETDGIQNAKLKLINKKCDLMIYNKINSNKKVFGSDYNKISIINDNKIDSYTKMSKVNCAKLIINKIHNLNNNIL